MYELNSTHPQMPNYVILMNLFILWFRFTSWHTSFLFNCATQSQWGVSSHYWTSWQAMVWLVCSSHMLHVRNRWPCPGGPEAGFPWPSVWPWHVPGGALAGHYHSFHLTEYGDDVEGELLNKSFWMHAGHLVVLNGITKMFGWRKWQLMETSWLHISVLYQNLSQSSVTYFPQCPENLGVSHVVWLPTSPACLDGLAIRMPLL